MGLEKSQGFDLANDLQLSGEAAVPKESLTSYRQLAALVPGRDLGLSQVSREERGAVRAGVMATCDIGNGRGVGGKQSPCDREQSPGSSHPQHPSRATTLTALTTTLSPVCWGEASLGL